MGMDNLNPYSYYSSNNGYDGYSAAKSFGYNVKPTGEPRVYTPSVEQTQTQGIQKPQEGYSDKFAKGEINTLDAMDILAQNQDLLDKYNDYNYEEQTPVNLSWINDGEVHPTYGKDEFELQYVA